MEEYQKTVVTSLDVYEVETEKTRPVDVNGRPFYAITYRRQGEITIKANGTTLRSEAGQITFVPKGLDYQTEVVADTSMIAIHFDVLDDTFFTEPIVLDDKDRRFRTLIQEVFSLYDPNGRFYFDCMAAFYSLLSLLNDTVTHREQQAIHPKIREAKLLLDSNFTDRDYNIARLVQTLQISDSYLRREFKKHYGISPIQYLKRVKIKDAKLMLMSDYYTIEQVAQKCGFSSTSYFIQTFHKETGYSPLNYKMNFLRQKNN